MKKIITYFRANSLRFMALSVLAFVGLTPKEASSQAITNPSPYCKANFTAMGAGPCTNNFGSGLRYVRFNSGWEYEEAACDNTVTSDYRYFPTTLVGRPRLNPGTDHVISVAIADGNLGNQRSVGIWIDFNDNGTFEASEYLGTGTNLAMHPRTTIFTRNLNLDCNVEPGVYRMRVMTGIVQITAAGPCTGTSYGETWDFDLEILPLAALPKPDFIVPPNIFVGTPMVFRNTTADLGQNFEWDLDLDNTINTTSVNYPNLFTNSGTRFLKLRIQGCGQADSVIKAFTVQNPSTSPGADFYANRTVVEEFDEVLLSDLSSNGPNSWYWEAIDPVDNFNNFDDNDFQATAAGFNGLKNRVLFEMMDMGFFDIRLTASNSAGSRSRTKPGYIEVKAFSEFRLGAGLNQTQLGRGTIFDKEGPNELYRTGANGDPSINRLRIVPCGAKSITLKVERFMLAQPSHNFKVWDGASPVVGTPLHPPGGFNINNAAAPFEIVATSGAMYMELDTEAGGPVDSGLIAYFESDFGTTGPPTPSIGIGDGQTVAYTRALTTIKSTSQNIFGLPEFFWTVNGNPVPPASLLGDGDAFTFNFNTAGTYDVCMEITSCAGDAVYCDEIEVVDPTGPTSLDFTASNIRPDAFQIIGVESTSDKANRFRWSIDPPGKFNFQPPFNETTKDLRGAFTEPGAYTFTLTAWNTLDSALTTATVSKQNYVVVVDYCTPSAQIVSGDAGLRNVRVTNLLDNTVVLNQPSSTGVAAYENFANPNDPATELLVGGSYNVTLSRGSNVGPASHAVFIDFNGDGEFSNDERVLRVMNSSSATTAGTFKVPALNNVYTDFPVRMRVVTAYGNEEPTACGPLLVGEYEDYLVRITPFIFTPVISLVGNDTLRVEQGTQFNDPGAIATDQLEGDISNLIVTNSDLDTDQTGIYFITYDVTNASLIPAETVTRIVIVTVDLTPPVLTLMGNNPDTIDVFSTYTEPGFTAFDAVDGDVTASVDVNSNLDVNILGTYEIVYTAADQQDNIAVETRTVVVVDRESPVINFVGSDSIELGTFWIDQTSVSDNYWSSQDISFTQTFGFSGPVRWDTKGSYTVHYTAVDGSGNTTTATRNYVVDDFTAPVVRLNTSDTVIHDVNTNYTPVQPTITDNRYPANQLEVEYSTNLNANRLGLYVETYRVTDGSGNVTVKNRWIRVLDRIAPVIHAPSFCTKVGYDFNPWNTITITDNYYAQDELIDLVQVVTSNVNPFLVGYYTASYEVTDPSGNRSRVTAQTIEVSENCELITSVEQVDLKNAIVAYPNPSDAHFTVDFSSFETQVQGLELVNQMGSVVATINPNDISAHKLKLDLSAHAAGVYFLNVKGADMNSTLRLVLVK